MKLKINYDLLESVLLSQNGININKTISHSFIKGLKWAVPASLAIGLVADNKALLLTLLGSAYAIYPLINILYHSIFKKECKEEFSKEINNIAGKLKKINVYTNKELLEQAKLIKKSYKLELGSNHVPYLKEYKHIEIETNDNNSVCLLQEHKIASKEYSLSVPDAKEYKQLVLVK